jgi:hypothetical protein
MTSIQTWGETSETMRALPNDRWRRFVENYVLGAPPCAAKAYRAAGLGLNSSTLDQAREAYRLLRDERVNAAVADLSKKYFRAAIPAALSAVKEILEDADHKDRARVALSLINRVDPEISRHELEITSRRILSHDEEAIEELQALRKLGVAPEKLIETFGEDGLARLERLEARQIEQRAERAKVIDAEIVDNEIVEAEELSIESEDDF